MKHNCVADQRGGIALMTALAFTALAVPLITGALGSASSVSIDSRVKADILKGQYSVAGGNDHAIYRLVYEPGYASNLLIGVPDTYDVTLNGQTASVTILKESDPNAGPPPPPDADSSRRLQTSKTVNPSTAAPLVPTVFTYTIIVQNRDNESTPFNQFRDILPPGFAYVLGSTRGITTDNPSVSGQELVWAVNEELQPGQSATLIFDALASVPQGNYCNEAWAIPLSDKTSSGQTALVRVGSPPNDLCQGAAAILTKTVTPNVVAANKLTTYTYTIRLQNSGSVTLNANKITDRLPSSFLYVLGSTSGDFTSANPATSISGGRQQLIWNLNPAVQINPGQTKTLTFRAVAQLPVGEYWNEVWMTINEFQHDKYTWPTAPVKVMGAFRVTVTNGAATSAAQVWLDSESYYVAEWEIAR